MLTRVSVIMPTFNSRVHIEKAIYSVLAQTYQHIELIVVDGGSTDGTVELIKEVSSEDDRIQYVNNIDDAGPAHARHTGIQICTGDYVAFLDSDDYWIPEKTEKQLHFMQENDVLFSYTGYRSVDEYGGNISCPVLMRDSYDLREALIYRGIGILTVMLERKVLTAEITNTSSPFAEDYLWWLLILQQGHIARHVDIDAARYRKIKNSRSKNRLKHQISLWNIYTENLGINVPSAAFYYIIYIINTAIAKTRVALCGLFYKRDYA